MRNGIFRGVGLKSYSYDPRDGCHDRQHIFLSSTDGQNVAECLDEPRAICRITPRIETWAVRTKKNIILVFPKRKI